MTRSVLVTGASTGIGRATAELLAEDGWEVLAGVRRDTDADAVRADRIHPVQLDVTSPDDLAALPGRVRELLGTERLDGLVNNAGVAVAGPLEALDLEELRWQLEVNVVGLVGVTQAVLPALRAATGRVVNIGSTGSRVTPPFMGPYTASKHAVVAINDALRQELARFGMQVVLLEPGAIATPIWDKGEAEIARRREAPSDPREALYPEVVDEMARIIAQQARVGIPARAVAEVVRHALTARRPRARYPVGRDAQVVTFLGRHLPPRWMDRLIATFR
ncbi:MAG: SDR family oxidoreductase [Alphaproteobacteria bacterium]|nr:SDR family oxidoreductase [Alphaproteobacteria bacterium]